MSEPASISTGIAARYATAIFEIAQENKNLDGLEAGLNDLAAALAESADFRVSDPFADLSRATRRPRSLQSPTKWISRRFSCSALGLMAQKRRLFVLPQLIKALRAMLADQRDEVTAEVTSAKAADQGAVRQTGQDA